MSTVENIDVNKYKLTFSVDAKRLEEGLAYSYNKNKNYFNVPGFRKGKAPRKIVEAKYGKEILYDDAVNFVLQDAYPAAVDESGLEVVSDPNISVKEISAENGATFEAEVYVKPEVKVSDYKGLTFTKKESDVTDEELNDEIKKELAKHSRTITITDRAVQNDDTVCIDFEGFTDGVAFEGGKGTDYQLKLGSGTFIPGFEDQLIGKNIGEDVDVNVTFPEEYHDANLSGKPALFKVKIKSASYEEIPELNDEFVQDTSEFESVDEYKNDIKSKLLTNKNNQIEAEKQDELIEKLIEKAEMIVPQAMIESEIDNRITDFKNGIERQGVSLETYLKYMGQSMENMREAYRIISEKQVKARLVLEAVAKNENIVANEEEIDAEVGRIAEAYGMDKDRVLSFFGNESKSKKAIEKDVIVQKAFKLVTDNAVEA